MSKMTVSKNVLAEFDNNVITLPNGAYASYINVLIAVDILIETSE